MTDAPARPNPTEAVDHLVIALKCLGYQVLAWRDTKRGRGEFWTHERQDQVARDHCTDSGILIDVLKGRDDMPKLDPKDLSDDEVIAEIYKRKIKVFDDVDDVLMAAIRVAFSGFDNMASEIVTLRQALAKRNVRDARDLASSLERLV